MTVGERHVAAITNEAFSPTLLNQFLQRNVADSEIMKQEIVDETVTIFAGTPKNT